jgi:secondary thiamine-phosphate synthase enzyme
LKITHTTITVSTKGKGLYEFTREAEDWLRRQGVSEGLLTAFVQHTSCSLVVQENADRDVVLDMRDFYERLVPETNEEYRHTAEGPDDMTSHIRSSLTSVSLSIPVVNGRMALGTWQGLYVFEHRNHPHQRKVVLQVLGN